MKLIKARVKGYRSIKDTGLFDVEKMKTIFVGPNEAGKTALLQALQKLNPPADVDLFDPLRDYPRSQYDKDIAKGGIDPSRFSVVEGHFALDDEDIEKMPEGFESIIYVYGRYLDNKNWNRIDNGIPNPKYAEIEKDLIRMYTHIDQSYQKDNIPATPVPSLELLEIVKPLKSMSEIGCVLSNQIISWLDKNLKYVDEANQSEEERFDRLKLILKMPLTRAEVLETCHSVLPNFILFNNYFKIKPSIHLEKLAIRTEQNILDDKQYDYGNNCLLKFLGFSARDLSTAGNTAAINIDIPSEFQRYKDQLDKRDYRLNAASVRLTNEIISVWNPNGNRQEASKLEIKADGQYLKVVVEDELGVKVELDQRSEGFQWLVSFFIVFFAEADEKHKNSILLLDEPGMSLHALKQAEFRQTLSKLSEKNQTIYSTHSPFLVGANELDLVRVIEMTDRNTGTIVHTSITATDDGALLPLQEALGYDLAQSLFVHKKNLVLEGLTDYWYIEASAELMKEAGGVIMDEKIAMIPASCASKVVYFATILHAQNLKVAALLDSDVEGEQVAKQDTLVNALGNKRILRTKDVYEGDVIKPEIEDLFRDTLVKVAKEYLGWDIEKIATTQIKRPIVDIFNEDVKDDFSKYKLAKAFLHWTKDKKFGDLTDLEQKHCHKLISKINKALI